MKQHHLPILVPLLILLSACGVPGDARTTPSAQPLPSSSAPAAAVPSALPGAPAEGPVWETEHYEKAFTTEDGTTLLTVSYSFPHLQNAGDYPPWQAINEFYYAIQASFVSSAEDLAQQQADEYTLSTQHGWDFVPVREEVRSTITRLTQHCISVTRTDYLFYEGAAHPFVSLSSEQLDLTTGTQLRFADCFTDPQRAAEQALTAILSSPEGADLQDSGISSGTLTDALQPEHFYLTDQGFVFWYQSGDLGTNHSPIEIPISYEIFDGLLQPWVA